MNDKVAQWATAISAAISAIVLVISIFKFASDSNKESVEAWQRVAVYEYILKNNAVNFDGIKMGYITESQQITAFDIPQSEIQDDALRKVLLGLQESRLIMLRDDFKYVSILAHKEPDRLTGFNTVVDILREQERRNGLFTNIRIKTLDLIRNNCGKYTQDILYREVSSQIDIEAPTFFEMLHSMRNRELKMAADNTWCETYDGIEGE